MLTKNILPGRAVGQTEGSRKSDAGVQHQKAALQAKLEGHFKAEKKKGCKLVTGKHITICPTDKSKMQLKSNTRML